MNNTLNVWNPKIVNSRWQIIKSQDRKGKDSYSGQDNTGNDDSRDRTSPLGGDFNPSDHGESGRVRNNETREDTSY